MDISNLVTDVWNQYMQLQKAHPHIGSMITAEFTFVASDMISQLMIDKKINPKKLRYTAILAPFYGASIDAVMQSGELVGAYISANPFLKSALGPNLFGNIMNSYFFVNNTVGEKSDYSITALFKNYAGIFKNYSGTCKERWRSFTNKFKERYIDNIPGANYKIALIGTLTAWNVIQTLNYAYFPEELRTPVCLGAGFLWTIILTAGSIVGGRKIAQQTTHIMDKNDSYTSS